MHADEDFSGSLTDTSIDRLLPEVAALGEGGMLHFTGGDDRIICFHHGEVYLATSASGPSLHQLLVGSGAATDEGWDAAREAESTFLLDTLLPRVDTDADRVRAVLYEHTVATIFELLVPGSDAYSYVAGEEHRLGSEFSTPVDVVLRDAGTRLERWREIITVIPSTATTVRRTPTLPRGHETATIAAVDWQVLGHLDEQRSVAAIIEQAGLSAFTVFDAIHRLHEAGLLERTSEQ